MKIIGSECGNERLQKAFVKLRINVRPLALLWWQIHCCGGGGYFVVVVDTMLR